MGLLIRQYIGKNCCKCKRFFCVSKYGRIICTAPSPDQKPSFPPEQIVSAFHRYLKECINCESLFGITKEGEIICTNPERAKEAEKDLYGE